jgi:hypothetical protein
MKPGALLLVLVLAACGQAPVGSEPGGKVSPGTTANDSSPGASPTARQPLGLLVVLEARGAGSTFGAGPGAYDAHDVVAIVGTDGYAKAKQSFKPRKLPFVGNAGAVVQAEARVADGAVFYIDGDGVVKRLAVNGTVTQVTRFPSGQPQQEISFAVSPDGKQLVASVLTLPARNPNAQTIADPPFVSGSHGNLELFAADAGGPARSLGRTDLGTSVNTWRALRVVGWDQLGPVVTLRQQMGSQQSSLGNEFGGFELAHLDLSGHPGAAITPDDCYPWQERPDMSVLCSNGSYGDIRLVDASGKLVARFPGASGEFLTLGPDASWLAYHGGAQNRNGARVILPDSFFPQGWLDASTIIGYQDARSRFGAYVENMALVRLSSPSHAVDLGFTGVLAGVL